MKTTMWTELHADQCTVRGVDERAGRIVSVEIAHPQLHRPLWFSASRAGNWYWRNTRERDAYADGYIVRGQLDGLVGAPRAYPELAAARECLT